MVDEIEITEEEHKDRIKFFNICERLARRDAIKYAEKEEERLILVQDLAISFLGNMTFRFFTSTATKSDYLNLISIIFNGLQDWYTYALNNTDFTTNKPRINLQ